MSPAPKPIGIDVDDARARDIERAVKTGNPNIVVAAAAAFPRLSLVDALLVVLVFARARAPQTEAAAVRWAARYLAEERPAPEWRTRLTSS